MKKRILVIFLTMFLVAFYSYAQLVEVINLQINETAKKVSPEQIWKTVKFNIVGENVATKITVTASAKDNGTRIADSLKMVLDKTDDFGWATDKAWSGRELKGKQKVVVIERVLKAGEHKLDFFADVEPTLFSVKVEVDNVKKEKPGQSAIKDANYLEKIGVKLTWTEATNAKTYEIYRAGSVGDFERVAQVNTLVYLDVSVTDGQVYRYKIVAVGDSGKGDFSEEFKVAIVEKTPPEIPKNLKVTNSLEKIGLTWDKSGDSDLAGYSIYKKEEEQKDYKKYIVVQKSEYEDTKVEVGKKYFYKVLAFDTNLNESDFSNEASATIKTNKYNPEGVCDIYPKEFFPGDKVTVFFSGKKSSEIRKYRQKMKKKDPNISIVPSKIFIHYGFNNWDNNLTIQEGTEPEMVYDEQTEYYTYTLEVPTYAKDVDFAFYDEYMNWDKNYSKDYIFKVQKDNVKPGPPKNIKATALNGAIFLEWDPPADKDVAFYTVTRSNDAILGWGAPGSGILDLLKTNYGRDENAKPGVTYYYRIVATDFSDNIGEYSVVVSSSALNVGPIIKDTCTWEPAEPTIGGNVRIYYGPKYGDIKDASKMLVKILNNGSSETAKRSENFDMLYDKMLGAWYYDYQFNGDISLLTISFTDGTKWDDNKKSNWTIKAIADKVPPQKLKGLKASSGAKSVVLEWEANREKDIEGYNVYRGGQLITQKPIKGTQYKDENLDENATYKYRVTPVDFAKNEGEGIDVAAKPFKDAIIAPVIDYNISISDNQPIKLMASLESVSKWQIDIINTQGKIIRMFTGKSYNIAQSWDLKDDTGATVTPGVYKYRVSIVGAKDIMPKEVQIIVSE